MLDGMVEKGIALAHDVVVSRCLARVLAGGTANAGGNMDEEELFGLEREAFLTLARTPETAARIAHMLNRGRPLRN
jgi:3-hydroxyacyl-CoA dehydrogenase